MARAKEFKIYVDTTNGQVFQKPVALAGVPFAIKSKFYEITPEQALRLHNGESMREVLREGMRKKLESDLTKAVGPLTEDEETVESLDALKTHAAVDAFAAEKNIEIPEGLTTIQAKKDHISTVLLTR